MVRGTDRESGIRNQGTGDWKLETGECVAIPVSRFPFPALLAISS